jgi:hypothetical protein
VTNKSLFDRRYGKGAFARLRSMLDDSTVTYERIAERFGFSKQRIGQLAKEFGVDGRLAFSFLKTNRTLSTFL